MNDYSEKFDKVLSESLKLKEEGMPVSEILDLFPKFRDELNDTFKTVEAITGQKDKIAPRKEILNRILSDIPNEGVTDREDNRYTHRGEVKGRSSAFNSLITKWLTMNKKIYAIVGVVVFALALGAGIFWRSSDVEVPPEGMELAYETESLSTDIPELDSMDEDSDLENLEQDLSELIEEESAEEPQPTSATEEKTTQPTKEESTKETAEPAVDVTDLENLENELNTELEGFSEDLTDLSGLEGDTLLDDLDSGLSGIAE